MPWLDNPADSPTSHLGEVFILASIMLHISPIGNLFSGRFQRFRNAVIPYGLYSSLCTLHLICSQGHRPSMGDRKEFTIPPLRLRRNTRYRLLVRLCRARTFTSQDAPSFAWRSNNVLISPAKHANTATDKTVSEKRSVTDPFDSAR